MEKKIWRSLSSNYVRMVLDFVVVVLSLPLLLSQLGTVAYGRWVVLLSVYQLLSILDLGLGQSLFRIVASEEPRKEDRFHRIFLVQSIVASMALLGCLFVGAMIGGMYWILWIAMLLLPGRLIQSFLNAEHRMMETNGAYMLGRLFYLGGLFFMVSSGWFSLSVLCSLFVVSQVIEVVFLLFFGKRYFVGFTQILKDLDFSECVDELRDARPFLWMNLSSQLFTRAEPILLKFLFGYHVVAMFDVAWRMSFYYFTCCRQIVNAFSPTLAASKVLLNVAMERTFQTCSAVSLPLFAFAIWHQKLLFTAWLGDSYSSDTLVVFPFLLSVMLMTLYQAILSMTLSLQGAEKEVARFLVFRSIVRLSVCFTAGYLWGWKAYVASMALIVAGTDVWLMSGMATKHLGISMFRLVFSASFHSLWALLALGSVMFFFPPFFVSNQKLSLVFHSVSEIGVYVVAFALVYGISWKMNKSQLPIQE